MGYNMSITDLIKRRKQIVSHEGQGINLAITLVKQYAHRTFTFKGIKNPYLGIKGASLIAAIQDELDSMIVMYRYETKAKTYTDKNGIEHANIRLIGRASVRGGYNPLDIVLDIATEVS